MSVPVLFDVFDRLTHQLEKVLDVFCVCRVRLNWVGHGHESILEPMLIFVCGEEVRDPAVDAVGAAEAFSRGRHCSERWRQCCGSGLQIKSCVEADVRRFVGEDRVAKA